METASPAPESPPSPSSPSETFTSHLQEEVLHDVVVISQVTVREVAGSKDYDGVETFPVVPCERKTQAASATLSRGRCESWGKSSSEERGQIRAWAGFCASVQLSGGDSLADGPLSDVPRIQVLAGTRTWGSGKEFVSPELRSWCLLGFAQLRNGH